MALTDSASCDFVVWTSKDIHIEEDHTAIQLFNVYKSECDEPKKKQNIYTSINLKTAIFIATNIRKALLGLAKSYISLVFCVYNCSAAMPAEL